MTTAAYVADRQGFCIFIDTICQEPIPIQTDGDGNIVVFETEFEAQREIAEDAMTRLREFLEGERDFDDAVTVEEYVVPVTILPDGSITDEIGNRFGRFVE